MRKTEANKYIGVRFGKLIVVEFLGTKSLATFVRCICDCGGIKETLLKSLKLGETKSCGCLRRENRSRVTHGQRHSSLYNVWCSMKARCYNPNFKTFKNYGGRGITVCDEWRKDFQSFYNWALVSGYEYGLQIDRFPDNNGNYEPANCRWTTAKANSNNRRNSLFFEFNGETKTLSEWGDIFGHTRDFLYNRIVVNKWEISRALTYPIKLKA